MAAAAFPLVVFLSLDFDFAPFIYFLGVVVFFFIIFLAEPFLLVLFLPPLADLADLTDFGLPFGLALVLALLPLPFLVDALLPLPFLADVLFPALVFLVLLLDAFTFLLPVVFLLLTLLPLF